MSAPAVRAAVATSVGASERRTITSLAWPVMVSNLLQTLTTTVDLIMVGALVPEGPSAIAAVGFGAQFLFLYFAIMISVSSGTIALVARAVGGRDPALADAVLKQSLLLGAAVSLPLSALGLTLAGPLLVLFGATPDVLAMSTAYVSILSLVTFPMFINFLGGSALRGAGDTRTPLLVGVLVNVVNFGINLNLIYGLLGAPRLGVTGAAIGTSISYVVGAAAYLALFVRGRGRLRLSRAGPWVDRGTARRILRVGAPAAVEQVLLQIAFFIWLGMVFQFGTDIVAAHQIGLRIQSFAFMPGFGFAIAATTLVGQNLGAGSPPRAERSGWEATKLSVAVMVGIGAAIALAAPVLARVFSSDPEVDAWAVVWIRIHAASIPAIGVYFTLDGALRGAGDTRFTLVTSALGMYAVRLPLAYGLGFHTPLGVVGVWIPLVIEYYVRSAVVARRFQSGAWKAIAV